MLSRSVPTYTKEPHKIKIAQTSVGQHPHQAIWCWSTPTCRALSSQSTDIRAGRAKTVVFWGDGFRKLYANPTALNDITDWWQQLKLHRYNPCGNTTN